MDHIVIAAKWGPTPHLRWNGGILEQWWEEVSYVNGIRKQLNDEWRPTVEIKDSAIAYICTSNPTQDKQP